MCIWVCVCIWTCVLEMVENLDVDIICDHFNYITCKYLILWYIKGNTSFNFIGGVRGLHLEKQIVSFLKSWGKLNGGNLPHQIITNNQEAKRGSILNKYGMAKFGLRSKQVNFEYFGFWGKKGGRVVVF